MYTEKPIKIETKEEMDEFVEGLTAMLERSFKLRNDISVRVAQLKGNVYDFSIQKMAAKIIPHYACYFAEYFAGKIDRETLAEKMSITAQKFKCGVEPFKSCILQVSKPPDAAESAIPDELWEKLVQKIRLAVEIAILKKIRLKDVFLSDSLSQELDRSICSLEENRLILKETINSFAPELLEELSLDSIVTADEITVQQYQNIEREALEDPDFIREVKSATIAVIVANEEAFAKTYGDSQEQKDKREMLINLLHGIEKKSLFESLSLLEIKTQ